MNEIVREFLLETHENLAQLDLDLVTLEKEPGERETLSRVFRTLHTIKGTSGFLGLPKLQAIAHAGENLLSRIRAGEVTLNPEIATGLLGVVDAIRKILASIETSEQEGDGDYSALVQELERLTHPSLIAKTSLAPPQAPTVPATQAAVAAPSATAPTLIQDRPPVFKQIISQQPVTATGATAQQPPVSIVSSERAEARTPVVSDSSIRVDVGLLDKLMNLVGELVLARNQIVQFSTTMEDTGFTGTVQRLNLLTTELQAGVMKTRMQPIGNVWGKFPRLVRDISIACGKQVRLDMEGQETELDKTIIEAIRDPLTHLVRNAIDHGIEPPAERALRTKPPEGRLLLHASHEGGKVIIEIIDDGGGIDPARVRDKAIAAKLVSPDQAARMSETELVNLVFLPGFSTADRVTHFSGRGVGMDVVRNNIEKIGGVVVIDSRLGRGTTVRMKIPLTLAIIPALTITSGGDRYAIPQVSLLELVRLEGDRARKGIELIRGVPVYRLRGNLLPLVRLDEMLQVNPIRRGGEVNIVILQSDDRQFGLIVDDIHDTEEIVVKPLQKQLKSVPVFSGATIMGDGRVALILDVLGLAQKSGVVSGGRERAMAEQPTKAAEASDNRQTVLICSSRNGGRLALPIAAVARLEEFSTSAVERVGGRDVIQYRGEILPLVNVNRTLHGPRKGKNVKRRPESVLRRNGAEKVHVVVHNAQGRQVGLVVDRILDIVEENIVTRSSASRPGVLFTAVVQERVTEFLDVEGIIRRAESMGEPA